MITVKQAGAGGIAAAIALAVPFIAQWEGHRSQAYRDVAGVLTVCEGHTGPDIIANHVYSPAECTALRIADVKIAVDGVLKVTPILEDKPYLLAAAVSFSYNVGISTYGRSSVARDFNTRHYAQGCKDLLKYVYAGGKFVKGLANRRGAEYVVCMKGV